MAIGDPVGDAYDDGRHDDDADDATEIPPPLPALLLLRQPGLAARFLALTLLSGHGASG
jgi:hypothetical protein